MEYQKNPVTHYNYGLLLSKMNRMEEAEVQYKLALETDPEDTDIHWNYRVLLEELGRKKEAAMQYLLLWEPILTMYKHIS
ncbi:MULTISPECIES: hypothetical protein [Methanosarcina]|uniref:hypothetical protein n=1 Tax=Methanosarcina TaxID=2207 RepID=UPI002101157E|nr:MULTISPECIES: hypothetical protein [Methanosarcina]